jgi:hypothetical protein
MSSNAVEIIVRAKSMYSAVAYAQCAADFPHGLQSHTEARRSRKPLHPEVFSTTQTKMDCITRRHRRDRLSPRFLDQNLLRRNPAKVLVQIRRAFR